MHSGTHKLALAKVTLSKSKGPKMIQELADAFDVPENIPKAKNKGNKK